MHVLISTFNHSLRYEALTELLIWTQEVAALAAEGRFDYLLIESTGK